LKLDILYLLSRLEEELPPRDDDDDDEVEGVYFGARVG